MSEDRLEEIKYRQEQVIYGDPGMLADLNWLISEVERLRDSCENTTFDLMVARTTIATLQKALKKHGVHSTECFRTHSHDLTIAHIHSMSPVSHQKGLTFPAGEINCTCGFSEALATHAQEE